MKLQNLSSQFNFKSALININALSDTHGHVERAQGCYQTMMDNDLFIKEQQGNQNYLIMGGDWFISGNKTGYKSDPKKPLGLFQLEIYNKFVSEITKKFPKTISLFTIGNHELDGSEDLFIDILGKINSQVISSNLDFENSPSLEELNKENKIVKSRIDYIPDSWKKGKLHPILNMAIAPVNMDFYNPTQKIKFVDDSKKHTPVFDIYKTLIDAQKQIENFKLRHPEGLVILTSHTGVGFIDYLAEIAPIDLAFDAHEHKDETRFVGKTPIISLSRDFKKLSNVKIKLDENSNIEKITLKSYNPSSQKGAKGAISALYETIFQKDIEKTYTIKAPDGTKELSTDGVRIQNSDLANFVTDGILSQIQKIDPDVKVFALNASSFRSGFNLRGDKNVSNFDILSCLDGINYNQANIYTTDVTGEELAFLVKDNLLFNQINPQRHPLIQYSGLKVETNEILANKNAQNKDLCKFLSLSNGEEIEPNKIYRIANPEKYFIKTSTPEIKKLFESSKPLGANVIDLFRKYFEENEVVEFKRDKRI